MPDGRQGETLQVGWRRWRKRYHLWLVRGVLLGTLLVHGEIIPGGLLLGWWISEEIRTWKIPS